MMIVAVVLGIPLLLFAALAVYALVTSLSETVSSTVETILNGLDGKAREFRPTALNNFIVDTIQFRIMTRDGVYWAEVRTPLTWWKPVAFKVRFTETNGWQYGRSRSIERDASQQVIEECIQSIEGQITKWKEQVAAFDYSVFDTKVVKTYNKGK